MVAARARPPPYAKSQRRKASLVCSRAINVCGPHPSWRFVDIQARDQPVEPVQIQIRWGPTKGDLGELLPEVRRDAAVAARAAQPADGPIGPQVTRQSLLADLANLTDRNTRLTQHITRLEQRLSDTLGQQAWHASGFGAPVDIDTLQQRIEHLEQHVADLTSKLDDRDDDLAAARATNRELMTQLNSASHQRR